MSESANGPESSRAASSASSLPSDSREPAGLPVHPTGQKDLEATDQHGSGPEPRGPLPQEPKTLPDGADDSSSGVGVGPEPEGKEIEAHPASDPSAEEAGSGAAASGAAGFGETRSESADEGGGVVAGTSWGAFGPRGESEPTGREEDRQEAVTPPAVPSRPTVVPAQDGRPPSSSPRTSPAAPRVDLATPPVPSPPAKSPALETTRLEQALARGLAKITGASLGRYQVAVVRIGFAFTWLCFLLREFPHRRELYGPDSPWSWDLGDQLVERNGAFTVLLWTDSLTWFELVYGLAILASFGLLVGWRTRTMSVLFMVGVLSLQNRSVFMGDGGDNVIHLIALYLVLTRCGLVWSLDARRARRRAADPRPDSDLLGVALWSILGVLLAALQLVGLAELSLFDRGPIPEMGWFPGLGWATVFWGLWLAHGLWWVVQRHGHRELRAVLDVLVNLVHNATLLVIMAEVCLVYSTAGWYKIQGSRWQDGTAVYYPMHLDYFAPWPSLSEALGNSGLMIMIATYGTVIVQVAFPFTLFNRKVKNVLLAVMMLEHASIAVLLGLPFFSMAMIAADAVFLPTVFLLWLGKGTGGLAARLRPGGRRPRDPDQQPTGAKVNEGAADTTPHDRTLVG